MDLLEEIVEDRVWRHGVEIVSHINWTHVARLRRSLGVIDGRAGENPLEIAARKARGTAVVVPLTVESGGRRRTHRVSPQVRRSA